MREINFEHYKIFYYVAKFQNITMAANYLFLSQPSISRCVKNLEDELGCKLFVRSKKGVELTTGGEMLFKHISIACKHIFSAEEELALISERDRAIVRLGGSEVALQSFLIDRIVEFHREHPKIQIKIDSMSTPDAIEALRANLIDVAVVTSPFADKTGLNINVIKKLQDIVAAGNGFSYLKDKEISLHELVKYPLICLKNTTTTRNYLDHIFRQHNLLLRPDIELTSINFVMPMVKNNLGIGFIQYATTKAEIEAGNIFRVNTKEQIPPRSICAVTASQYETPEPVQRFMGGWRGSSSQRRRASMSRPKYPWWGYVREILRRYPDYTTEAEAAAVTSAIAQTGQMPDGQRRLSVIGMVFFRKTHTLHGAALEASCSYATAKRWQQAFIREVACNFKCNSLIES